MRIALLVAFAYLVFVPFIINLVDARPRYDAGYRAVAYDYRMEVYELSRPEKAIY
jgi:hypothetical protein